MENQFQKFQERIENQVNKVTETVKERYESFNLKEEVTKVRSTIENIPTEVKGEVEKVTATIKNIPTEVKERIEKFDANEELGKAREGAVKLNDFAVENTEATLDVIFKGGEKWNGMVTKAVNVGLQLTEKNIDLVFNTLEAAKEQVEGGTERFKNLFRGKN